MKIKERFLATPRRRQLAISGAIIGTALLTSASIFATGPNASPAAPVEKAWPVSVTTVAPGVMHPSFSAFGRLESNQVASLRSDLIAQIKEVTVKEGDWAEAGEVRLRHECHQRQRGDRHRVPPLAIAVPGAVFFLDRK